MSKKTKMIEKKRTLLIIIVLSIFIFALSYNRTINQTDTINIPPIVRLKTQQDFNFTIVPDGFADDLVEMFLDILWDIDGSTGFEGIFPLAYSYIPFLGSNGTVFTDIIFILSISLGAIVLAFHIRRLRGV